MAIEVKVGSVNLTPAIQAQINKDIWLRANSDEVSSVEWMFYPSSVTGKGGPSAPLMQELIDNNIPFWAPTLG